MFFVYVLIRFVYHDKNCTSQGWEVQYIIYGGVFQSSFLRYPKSVWQQ